MDHNTINYRTLKFIFQCGQIRKSSLTLFLSSQHDTADIKTSQFHAYRNIKQLLDRNLIETMVYHVKRTNNHKTDTEEVYQLTKEGVNRILETEHDLYYSRIAPNCLKKFARRKSDELPSDGIPFETDRIELALSHTDIFAMMAACDIPVFQHDKPSLLYLSDTIAGSHPAPKKGYRDNLTKAECLAALEKGIYYTSSEFYDYMKKISPGIDDMISGSRAKGIFLSNKSCYAVYTSKKYDNKILRANIKGENGMVRAMNALGEFTDIIRRIPEFDEVTDTGRPINRFKTRPDALFLSDGDVLAYSIATGSPKGKSGKSSLAKRTASLEKNFASREEGNKVTTYLTAASELYDRMFIIPTTSNGVFTLQYLLSHSIEDWKTDGESIMDENKDTFVKSKNDIQIFKHKVIVNGKTVPVTYMPVIEAKTLYAIANSDQNPVILTFKDLLNVIARSIRKDGIYYNVDEEEMFDRDEVFIYDQSGNIKGESILDHYLIEQGKTFYKKTEASKLPDKFNMTPMAFYNAIARGELNPEDVAEQIDTIEYVEKPKYYKKTVTRNFSMSKKMDEELKAISEREHIPVSKIIRDSVSYYLQHSKKYHSEK